ncbi:MAG: hypothetical protein ACYDCO_09910 [Armatimonadota bacterium]
MRQRIRQAPISPPPYWKKIASQAIGGLTEVGFAEDSDLLLVVSSQGRGVFDCATGERIARDRESPDDDGWYDEHRLQALGIGPLEGKIIRLAGLHGGGLRTGTHEGWHACAAALEWPVVSLLLVEPWKSIFDESAPFTKLAEVLEFRAFGFSYTGNSLIFATSSDITIFHTDPAARSASGMS